MQKTMRIASANRLTKKPTPAEAVFLLENGARMDRRTFHELYLFTPESFGAELIGGEVYVSSPVSARHSVPHARLVGLMLYYVRETPGIEVHDNCTTILGEHSEPQPDAALAIERSCGGQSRINKEGYLEGAPELVGEIAASSAAIDLGKKKEDYEKAGVLEYLVFLMKEQELIWHTRREGGFEPLAPSAAGILKSQAFPGFWLSERTFFERRLNPDFELIEKGLTSPEHAAFVAQLKTRRKKKPAAKPKRKGK
jgi:Uma2 family endonuclease